MGFFEVLTDEWEGGGVGGFVAKTLFTKICDTYSATMKLANLKKILKIYNLCDKPLELCWHQPEISNFFWVFKDCLINVVFWKKYFEIKVTASYFLSITARHDSNYILGMVMRPNFGNVAFLWEKLSKPRFCKDLIRKSNFFRSALGSSSII